MLSAVRRLGSAKTLDAAARAPARLLGPSLIVGLCGRVPVGGGSLRDYTGFAGSAGFTAADAGQINPYYPANPVGTNDAAKSLESVVWPLRRLDILDPIEPDAGPIVLGTKCAVTNHAVFSPTEISTDTAGIEHVF